MSGQFALEDRTRVPFVRSILPRVAVCAALVLSRSKPKHLKRVLKAASKGARAATQREASKARREVVGVSVVCSGQGCLPRSIAVAVLCRMRGSWPDWCTGVRTSPFIAHAWVEAEGIPIGETFESGHFYVVSRVSSMR